MSAIKSDIVASSSSLNTKDPTEKLNTFDLRLQAFSRDLNNSLVYITRHHDANKAQFDSVTTSISNFNSMCGQLTQRQSVLEQQTYAINKKMDLLLKHMGKHVIGEYVDETVTTHVSSPHTLAHHTLGVQVLLEVHISLINSQMVCMTIWVK